MQFPGAAGSSGAGDRSGRWWVGKDVGLEPQALAPVFPCPPWPSLGPGVPTCKTGSQDKLVHGSLPVPMCHDFGLGDGEATAAWTQVTSEDAAATLGLLCHTMLPARLSWFLL